MTSVKKRISEIKQPRGGYVNPKAFTVTKYDDHTELKSKENIGGGLVGSAVDYLTRFVEGDAANKAFSISMMGAFKIGEYLTAAGLLSEVKGLDDCSIDCACKLTGFDVCYRSGPAQYRPVEEIEPDEDTIFNIRTMVNRAQTFFREYGPVTSKGFTFGDKAYTKRISSGDGDYLTASTLWDFKTSTTGPNSSHTLQLLVYYLMGKRSGRPEFRTIEKLGIFNPRSNTVYLLEVAGISPDVIRTVSTEVIGYSD